MYITFGIKKYNGDIMIHEIIDKIIKEEPNVKDYYYDGTKIQIRIAPLVRFDLENINLKLREYNVKINLLVIKRFMINTYITLEINNI